MVIPPYSIGNPLQWVRLKPLRNKVDDHILYGNPWEFRLTRSQPWNLQNLDWERLLGKPRQRKAPISLTGWINKNFHGKLKHIKQQQIIRIRKGPFDSQAIPPKHVGPLHILGRNNLRGQAVQNRPSLVTPQAWPGYKWPLMLHHIDTCRYFRKLPACWNQCAPTNLHPTGMINTRYLLSIIWSELGPFEDVYPIGNTVDGQKPAPPRMIIIPLFIGF